MGFAAFLNLKGQDIAAFFAASVFGYLAGTLVPDGAWSVYTSILVSYHLFLVWLVVTAEHQTGVSLSPVSTIVTHLACLAIILPLGMGRHVVPFFGIFRYGIASLAIFERGWLFGGKSRASEPKDEEIQVPAAIATSTADDYEEWRRYLAQQRPGSRKPGTSLKSEYEQWLLARPQGRPAEPATDTRQSAG
jgi:hypothetical protein